MFAPKIVYKPGKENVVADALSRIGDASQPAKESLEPLYLYASWSELPKELQSDWPLSYVAGIDDKVRCKELKAMLEREKPNFVIKNGRIFRIIKQKEQDKPSLEVPFVPFSQRADLVSKYHESFGHASVRNLMHLMGKRYWWPRMKMDITEWIAPCPACQLNSKKVSKHQDEMHPLPIPVGAFERWHLDFVGELPHTKDGNRWLITAVDATTNWPIACALPDATKESVAQFIYKEIVTRFGCPVEFVTDRGANFCSQLVQEYVKLLGSHHKLTSAFHPRTNGKVERYNGTVKDMLRKYVQGALHRWDEYVDVAVWSSRVWKNATTGYSPFFLVYGREPRLPGDAIVPFVSEESMQDPRTVADITARKLAALGKHREAAQARMKTVSDRDKERWDKAMGIVDYKVGDLVLLTHEGKFGLEPRFKGPYIITQAFDDYGTYQLETIAGQKLDSLVHRDRLKRAKGDKPDEVWYDPTASRRLVKEATSSRSGRVLRASLPSGGRGGGGSHAATAGVSSAVDQAKDVDRSHDASTTAAPTSPNVPLPTTATPNASVPTSEQEPELASDMYGSQEGVSPFVDVSRSVLAEDVIQHNEAQQQQEQHSSEGDHSGMSDVGGDGNSTMDEEDYDLKHVVDAYGDISPYEEEFDSAMSEMASEEEETKAAEDNIKSVIEGYDGISSADELADTLDVDAEEDSSKILREPVLTETEVDGDGDISVTSAPPNPPQDIDESATTDEIVEDDQIEQDEFSDPIVVTNDDAAHNQEETGGQDHRMEETGSPTSSKMEDKKTAQAAGSDGPSVDHKKKISPFAFVAKQSRKAFSWQKFRGTDDSLHENEHFVGPANELQDDEEFEDDHEESEEVKEADDIKKAEDVKEPEDVAGPTSVSKGDNVMDMFDGLVPQAVLRHNMNKRRVFRPTIPVRRPFRKKQKLTVLNDVKIKE